MMSNLCIQDILLKDEDPVIRMVTAHGETETNRIFSFSHLSNMDLIRGLNENMGLRRPNIFGSVYMGLTMTKPALDLVCQMLPTDEKFNYYVLSMLSKVKPEKKYPQALCLVDSFDDRDRVS